MSHLMGPMRSRSPRRRSSRAGQALGYTLNLPARGSLPDTKEELVDWMTIALAGRAAEQIVFGQGHERRGQRPREGDRHRAPRWCSSGACRQRSRRGRAGPTTTRSPRRERLRDSEQGLLTDHAYAEAQRLLDQAAARCSIWVATALLLKETWNREELLGLFGNVEPESHHGETVGTIRALPATPHSA